MSKKEQTIVSITSTSDSGESFIISAQKKANIADFKEGILPYVNKIFAYLQTTAISVSDTPSKYEEMYLSLASEQAKKILFLIKEYLNQPEHKRIPSIWGKSKVRNDLIENLKLIVSGLAMNYQTLVQNQNIQNNDKKNTNILMKNNSSNIIITPTYQESYSEVNFLLPIKKSLYSSFSILEDVGYIIKKNPIKITVILLAAGSIAYSLLPEDESKTAEETEISKLENNDAYPYKLITYIRNEIMTNNSSQIREIFNSEKNDVKSSAAKSGSTMHTSLADVTINSTINGSACLKLLDNKLLYFKNDTLYINGIEVTQEPKYSNMHSTNYEHPSALLCKSHNNRVSLKFKYDDLKSYPKSDKEYQDIKHKIIGAYKFYYGNHPKGKRNFELEHNTKIVEDLKYLHSNSPSTFNDLLKELNNPKEIFSIKVDKQ